MITTGGSVTPCCAAAERAVHPENGVGVDHELDVALCVEVQVGAVNREPHVGQTLVGIGDMQGVGRTGRFVKIRTGDVHGFGRLEIEPAAGLGEGVDVARVLVGLDRRARCELGAHNPDARRQINLEELQQRAVAEINKGQVRLVAEDGLRGGLNRGHATKLGGGP